MKPPTIPLDQITALTLLLRTTIPIEYQDENGHMNVRWYMAVFDDAGYPFVAALGLTPEYHAANGTGGFDLEHHLHYLRKIHIGDTVAVYVRVLARTAKRMHYMMFLVNETRGTLAATFECINSFADLRQRRTAPYPPEIAERLDAQIARDAALGWDAPVCGAMQP